SADATDRVAHIVDRLLCVAAELELDGGELVAARDGRAHVVDARDGSNRVLDFARHLRFQLRGRNSWVIHAHGDRRDIQVRAVLDPQALQADDAGDRQRHEQDDDGNGTLDRPGREIHVPASSLTTVILSPSCRKPAPRSTTRSAALRPVTISTRPSRTPPVSTRRRSTLWSPVTTNT